MLAFLACVACVAFNLLEPCVCVLVPYRYTCIQIHTHTYTHTHTHTHTHKFVIFSHAHTNLSSFVLFYYLWGIFYNIHIHIYLSCKFCPTYYFLFFIFGRFLQNLPNNYCKICLNIFSNCLMTFCNYFVSFCFEIILFHVVLQSFCKKKWTWMKRDFNQGAVQDLFSKKNQGKKWGKCG